MKKELMKKSIILCMVCLIGVTSIYAATRELNKDLQVAISEMNNIRRQLMAITESGYLNHIQEQSNENNIALVKSYIEQIERIRNLLQPYQKESLDKFDQRNLNTILATTLYLKDMGENLIDYLATKNLKEQFAFLVINLQINEFILDILADIQQLTLS